jgi:pilus assembly protein CpaE
MNGGADCRRAMGNDLRQRYSTPRTEPASLATLDICMATALRFLDDPAPSCHALAKTAGTLEISVAVVDPDDVGRRTMVGLVHNSVSSPVREIVDSHSIVENARWLADQLFDVVLIGLDHDPELALRLIKSISTVSSATVMVYSQKVDCDLIMRSMSAGAREFFVFPVEPDAVSEALLCVKTRIQAVPGPDQTARAPKTARGFFTFLGAKGGSGTTTIASNFAISVATLTGQKTLLIDLDLPLGDAALGLGIATEFSTLHALENTDRLDSTFLSRMLVRHDSGLFVLAAPGKFQKVDVHPAAIDKLLNVANRTFDNVIVDMGSHFDSLETRLFEMASEIYLVSQVGIPELRNANRLITGQLASHGHKLQVILNRFLPKTDFSEKVLERALTRRPEWRIPSDYRTVTEMQKLSSPLSTGDSAIAQAIRAMAQKACRLPSEGKKKKRLLGLF